MDDGLYVDSVWYSCKIDKMKTKIINIANDISKLSNSELSELSGVLMNEHDISATLYHFGISNSVQQYDTFKTYDIYLIKTGMRKLQIVKAIKDLFGWGLREAKALTDNIPSCIKADVSHDEAIQTKNTLEGYGAKIEIKDNENNVIPDPPAPPLSRIITEGTSGSCPKCGSTEKLSMGFGRVVGCIQPKCENFWENKRYQI